MAKTYNDIYISARRALKNAGIEAFSLEARLIVAQAAGKTVEQFTRDLPLYAGPEFEETVDGMIQRRLQGEPVAYITGNWEFYGVPLQITKDVLIPRADSEVLVEAALKFFENWEPRPRIIDLCAGSGSIGIALGVHMPGSKFVLVDIDHKALSLCRKNVQLNHLDDRVICIDADVTKKPPLLLGKFDMRTANAPYGPTGEIEDLDPSVKDYEPYTALDGGEDGLDIIRPIISLWKSVLKDNGAIMLEIGEDQSHAVQKLLKQAGFTKIHALQDTGGTERIIVGKYSERQERTPRS